MTKYSTSAGPRRLLALVCVLAAAVMIRGAATEPKNDFRFSILGDRTGGHHPGIYPRIWREVDLLAPDFAINVGDSIEGYIKDPKLLAQEANRQWDEVMGTYAHYKEIPMLWTPGNHDIWNAEAQKVYRERTGCEPSYVYKHQSALFIVLDNSRTEDLSPAQYQYLEEQLKANPDARPKFVIFHRPFWIPLIHKGDQTFKLHQLCKQYQVPWVICGHGHQLTYLPFDGVNYLEVGSSGGTIGQRPDGSPAVNVETGRFFHHVLCRVRGSQVRMTVKELGGKDGGGRTFDLSNWRGIKPQFDLKADPYEAEKAAKGDQVDSDR